MSGPLLPVCTDGDRWHAWRSLTISAEGTEYDICMDCGIGRITYHHGAAEKIRYVRPGQASRWEVGPRGLTSHPRRRSDGTTLAGDK